MVAVLVSLLTLLGISVAALVIRDFMAKRSEDEVRLRAARIHTALGRLSRNSGDQAALATISEAVGDRAWMLRPDMRKQLDLWGRALGFAFSNIGTPEGRRVLEGLVVPLASSSIFGASSFLQKVTEAIRNNPDRRDIHEALRKAIQAVPEHRIATNQSEWLYRQMLDIVKQQPNQTDIAVLTLDLGRWHCSRVRPDRRVTVYDEQMIQNDIAVRRAGS